MSPATLPRRVLAVRSAELLLYKQGNPSTEGFRHSLRLGLREHPNHRLGARGTDEHAPVSVELRIDLVEAVEQRLRQVAAARSWQIEHDLWVALHLGGRLGERRA